MTLKIVESYMISIWHSSLADILRHSMIFYNILAWPTSTLWQICSRTIVSLKSTPGRAAPLIQVQTSANQVKVVTCIFQSSYMYLSIKFLEFWFGHWKCHFLWSENGHFCQKCPSLRPKKWHFEWPNQNSKTTFIVQTFPKYRPYDFYFVNLSLLGAIWAIF